MNEPVKKRRISGAVILVAAAFLAREALVWLYNQFLDAVSAGVRGGVQLPALEWQEAAALVLVIVGAGLLLWPANNLHEPKRDPLSGLAYRADDIIHRARYHRAAQWFERDRLEPVGDIARDGLALLVSFNKAGCRVPEFGVKSPEQLVVGLEAYFLTLLPLIKNDHYAEARAASKTASEHAVTIASQMTREQWFRAEP